MHSITENDLAESCKLLLFDDLDSFSRLCDGWQFFCAYWLANRIAHLFAHVFHMYKKLCAIA